MTAQVKQLEVWKRSLPIVLGFTLIGALSVCPCPGQDYAYVSNEGAAESGVPSDVTIIDLATNEVITTVTVGELPQGVAVNPAGTAAYVANTLSNDVTVIDTATYETTTIPAGATPCGVAVHPNGRHIYVANADFLQDGVSSVMVIDRATNQIVDTLDCGKGSVGVAVHPAGSEAYVANISDGTVAVFDTATHKVTDTIALKPVDANEACSPVPIHVHPDGTFVYVANRDGPTLWAINTTTHESMARAFGHNHCGIGIHPAGTVLYLPDLADAWPEPPMGTEVEVIDARTLERITTLKGLAAPVDVSVHPDGTRLYITNWGANTISVLDATTYSVLATIPGGNHPNGFGEFVGPGVPRLLKQEAVARLQAVQEAIAGGADGVNSPPQALEYLATALTAGNACLQDDLWSAGGDGKVDPRRLNATDGSAVFASGQTTVEAILDAIRRGWIVNARLEAELLAVVNEVVRADRVLAAVAMDDAIMAQVKAADLDPVQQTLEQGDACARQAAVWPQLEKKASLLHEAISDYQGAWEMVRDLVP